MTEPTNFEQDQNIDKALDNSILDWNNPKLLMSLEVAVIYPQLRRIIKSLIEAEVKKARIAENQIYLDRINNFKPKPGEVTTANFGSASGAMEVASFKRAFEDRIAELKEPE